LGTEEAFLLLSNKNQFDFKSCVSPASGEGIFPLSYPALLSLIFWFDFAEIIQWKIANKYSLLLIH
jgi:hypothetical protein